MARRTLVVHTGGIGDFVLACPVLQHLATEGPLELAGRKERLQLAVDAGIAETAHDLDAIAFGSLFGEPQPRLVEFVRRFERVIVWMRDGGVIAETLHTIGVPDGRVFPGLPPDDWTRHASEYYADCLALPCPPEFRLPTAPSPDRPDIAIHPGSGAARKNWPLDRYQEIGKRLRARGRRVQWSDGPAEEGTALPADADRMPPQSLSELASRLAAARLYLGNDSGITHLAAAVGCPTIAIFGATNPAVWAPRGRHVQMVQGSPWPEVEDVWAAVAGAMGVR